MAYPLTLSQSLLPRRPKPGDPDYDPRLRSPYQDFSGGPSSDNPHGNWPLNPASSNAPAMQYFDLPSALTLGGVDLADAPKAAPSVPAASPAPRLSSGQPITLQPNPITGEVYRPTPAFVGPPDLTDLSPRALPASDPKSVAFVGPQQFVPSEATLADVIKPFWLRHFSGANDLNYLSAANATNASGRFEPDDRMREAQQIAAARNPDGSQMTPAQFEAMMSRPQVQRQPFNQTYIGSNGVTTYGVGSDGKYTGAGDYRGVPFNSLAGAQDAAAAWHGQQGARETGIAGTPSIESILSNQLRGTLFDGLDNGATERRLAAIGIQNKLSPLAAAIEGRRIEGQYGVQEAEARRKDIIHGKLLDNAQMNVEMHRREHPSATPSELKAIFDKSMQASSGWTGVAARSPQAEAAASTLDPIKEAAVRNARSDLYQMLSRGQYNTGFGQTLVDKLNAIPETERQSAINEALSVGRAPGAEGGVKELTDALIKSAAYDWLHANPQNTPISMMAAGDRMSPTGLPFQIVSRGMTGPASIVMPDNRNIPLHWSERPYRVLNQNNPEEAAMRQAAKKRLESYPSLIQQFMTYNGK